MAEPQKYEICEDAAGNWYVLNWVDEFDGGFYEHFCIAEDAQTATTIRDALLAQGPDE